MNLHLGHACNAFCRPGQGEHGEHVDLVYAPPGALPGVLVDALDGTIEILGVEPATEAPPREAMEGDHVVITLPQQEPGTQRAWLIRWRAR